MAIKKILKLIGKILISVIIFVGLYFLAAYTLARIEVKAEQANSKDVAIYILTNGVHTDIVAPIKSSLIDWSQEIKFEHTSSKDSAMQFVAFGWGDKGFYLDTPTWAELKFSVAFKAVFGLSSAAVHTTFYKSIIESDSCKKIELSSMQYLRLIKYIENSFTKDNNGHFVNIITKANYGNNDAFYEAPGRYNLFFTCNTWTNSGLKACGAKACVWTPFEKGVFYWYRNN